MSSAWRSRHCWLCRQITPTSKAALCLCRRSTAPTRNPGHAYSPSLCYSSSWISGAERTVGPDFSRYALRTTQTIPYRRHSLLVSSEEIALRFHSQSDYLFAQPQNFLCPYGGKPGGPSVSGFPVCVFRLKSHFYFVHLTHCICIL